MKDTRDLLEVVGADFTFPDGAFERLVRRRERKRRNQRIGSALVAILVSSLAIAALIRAFAGPPETGDHSITPRPDVVPTTRVALVDIHTGEARALPATVVRIPGAHQFHVSADGSLLTFSGLGSARCAEHSADLRGRDRWDRAARAHEGNTSLGPEVVA